MSALHPHARLWHGVRLSQPSLGFSEIGQSFFQIFLRSDTHFSPFFWEIFHVSFVCVMRVATTFSISGEIGHLIFTFFWDQKFFFPFFLRSDFIFRPSASPRSRSHRFWDRTFPPNLRPDIELKSIVKTRRSPISEKLEKVEEKGLAEIKARKKGIYKSVGTLVRPLWHAAALGLNLRWGYRDSLLGTARAAVTVLYKCVQGWTQ